MSVWDAFKFALNVYLMGTVITFFMWLMIVAVSRFTKKG
jgi:hypothetical protein